MNWECGADEGSHSHGRTPRSMAAGQPGGDLQAWQRRLYDAEGVLLHIPAEQHWNGGQKSGRGALVRRGQRKRVTERRTIREQDGAVSHRRSGYHGWQSSCSDIKRPHNRRTFHGHQGSLPKRGKRKTSQLTEGQTNGWRAYMMVGELSLRTVEMIIEGNAIESHPVEAGVPQGSPVLQILFVIYTSGLIKWVEQYISNGGLYFVNDLGWVATRSDVNQVVTTLERCAAKSIEWAGR